MEKFPIKKFNQVRKVASAAIHIAAMDPSHAALKPEINLAHIARKPEMEITQVQQGQASPNETLLDKQLKKTTEHYFKQEKMTAPAKTPALHERFKDFRRSGDIEDRRVEDNSLKEMVTAEEMDSSGHMVPASSALPPGAYNTNDIGPIGKTTVLGEKLGADDIEKSATLIHEQAMVKLAKEQAETDARYEEYRKTTEKIDHTWDPKVNE